MHAGTVFTGFERDLAPGIRVLQGAAVFLQDVWFQDLKLRKKTKGTIFKAAAIAAYTNTRIALVVRHVCDSHIKKNLIFRMYFQD